MVVRYVLLSIYRLLVSFYHKSSRVAQSSSGYYLAIASDREAARWWGQILIFKFAQNVSSSDDHCIKLINSANIASVYQIDIYIKFSVSLYVCLCVCMSVSSTLETLYFELFAIFFSFYRTSDRECFSQIRI